MTAAATSRPAKKAETKPTAPEQCPRSKSEIADELQALQELPNRVPQFSVFGDDNHEAIAAQIHVITEGMSFEQVLDEYEYEEEGNPYILCAVIDAFEWLRNDGDPVSESWPELIAA